MSNPMLSLGSAVYNALAASATVSVYHTLAPQTTAPPFCVFQAQNPGIDEYTWSANSIVRADYAVKIISDRRWPVEAATIYTHIHSAMQGARFDSIGTIGDKLPGYSALRCERTQGIQYRDADGFWHVGGVYRIEIQET